MKSTAHVAAVRRRSARSAIPVESLPFIDLARSRAAPPSLFTAATRSEPASRALPLTSAAASTHRRVSSTPRPFSFPSRAWKSLTALAEVLAIDANPMDGSARTCGCQGKATDKCGAFLFW
jgi:hypothetical protein